MGRVGFMIPDDEIDSRRLARDAPAANPELARLLL
jgi:hypothetical protein